MIHLARQRLIGIFLLVTIFAFNGSVEPVRAEAPQELLRRWAILASPDVSTTGLSDLLTAELSQRSFWLVEREQLAAITKEIELSKLLSPDGSSQRLKVGQLTKADALVLLSLVEHNKKKFLKLVISDCQYGSRLKLEHYPFAAEGVEPLVSDIVCSVEETRKRFVRGVERIVAVMPFVSRNLTHDFDHQQSGYAVLLQSSLADAPGVALLEVEEARQIQKELTLAGAELGQRRVPLLIEGEFEVTGNTEQPIVRLAVEVVGAKSDRQRIEQTGLGRDEVVNQLTRILPATLWQMIDSTPREPLSRQQQFEWLAARAQVMADVQSFEHSIGLREAALLLDPSDVGQRVSLLQECQWLSVKMYHDDEARRRDWSNSPREVQQTLPQPPFRYHERRQLFEISTSHLEFLMNRRLLNQGEAAQLVSGLANGGMFLLSPVTSPNVDESIALYHQAGSRLLPLLRRLDPRLRQGKFHSSIRSFVPSVLSVTSQRMLIAKAGFDWEQVWIISVSGNRRAKPAEVKLWLARVEWLFNEVFPTDSPLPQPLEMVLAFVPTTAAKLNAPESELRAVYQRLAKKPAAVGLYGRIGLVQLDGDAAKTAEALKPLQRELLALRFEFAELLADSDCDDKPAIQRPMFASIDALDARWRRKELQSANPNDGRLVKKIRLPRNPIPTPSPRQRVQFRPLEFAAPWIGWQRCADSLDVAWSHSQVDVIEPGRPPRQVLSVELPDRIVGVTWDGKVFWIATIKRGIQLISPSGEIVAQLPPSPSGSQPDATGSLANTLPPFESLALPEDAWRTNRGPWSVGIQGLAPLWPIEPGRCLAVGLIGREKRGWIAELQQSPTKPSVVTSRIFHTTTKAFDRSGAKDSVNDAQIAFLPIFMLEWQREQQRTLLLGRQPSNGYAELPPLVVDIKTLEVRVDSANNVPKVMHSHYVASGDRVVASWATSLDLLTPGASPTADWIRSPLFDNRIARRWGTTPYVPPFVASDGSVLIPSRHWSRVDVRQGKFEELTTHPLPFHQRFEFYASSAVYGCVAWNYRDRLYQVLIDQPWEDWDKTENSFAFVPESKREQHVAAVRRIQELGGHVGTHWGANSVGPFLREAPIWSTIVFLPAEWKGGDEQLRWLEDLHQVVDLRLVQAPITNAGAERIGRLKSLQSLRLIETRMTDDGLVHFEKLPALGFLHLEGTAGGNEFTDRGLDHVSHIERIGTLHLYGAGFTDEGLTWLQRPKALHSVFCVDTTFSPSGMRKLLAANPRLHVSTNPSFPAYVGFDTE